MPYLDVLSESVNNPLRLLLGWYAVLPVAVPLARPLTGVSASAAAARQSS